MARPETISAAELIARLGQVFLGAGYEGASLAMLSRAAGLAKAALYHRFPGGKEEIALRVLDARAREMAEAVLGPLSAAGTPPERLAAMVAALRDFYEDGAGACLSDLFSVGGVPRSVREPLAVGLEAWMAAIAAVLAEAGFAPDEAARRAEDAVVRVQGALVVGRASGDTSVFRRLMERLVADLLNP